ncbi:MAG: hypothetical protein M0P71_06385 [Melioribacteraceae bacterium]|nr:hypothetical protein [Melioribacteraceae bacterium]
MSGLIDLWLPKYENRKVWRDRAVNEYIDSIKDEQFREIIRNSMSGTIPVSLFGKSQVGKTTFLLKLMDIKSECLETIHNILRCGSKEGSAATPTAMIYKKIPEEIFKVHYSDKVLEFENEDGIREELISLRKKVEEQTLNEYDEIIIEIPERYFNQNNEFDIQICDLPGIESTNEKERPHVEEIIKKFIPISALILVFQSGDKIHSASDLFNNKIMSDMYGWKYVPERYRLIITRSYSADSIEKLINSNQLLISSDHIRDHYRKQAGNDITNPDNVPDNVKIFPFEFGDSYKNILPTKYTTEQFNEIDSVMDIYWKEIKEDIKNVGESGNTVQRLSIIPSLLLKLINEKTAEKVRLLNEKQTEINNLEQNKNNFVFNNQINEEQVEKLNKEREEYRNTPLLPGVLQYFGKLIRNDIIKKIDDEKTRFRQNVNETNKWIYIECTEKWNEEVAEIFREIRAMVSKIRRNIGFGPIGPDKKHVNKLNDQIRTLNLEIDNNYNKFIIGKRVQFINESQEEIRKLNSRIELNNTDKVRLETSISMCEKQKETIEKKYSDEINNYQSELNADKSILNFMKEEILSEKDKLLSKLGKTNSVDSFLDILFISLIIKEYEKQLHYN